MMANSLEVQKGLWRAYAVGLLEVERVFVARDGANHDCVTDVAAGKVVREDFAVDACHFLGAIPQGIQVVSDDVRHTKLPGNLAYGVCDVNDDNSDVLPEDGAAELEAFLTREYRLRVLWLN